MAAACLAIANHAIGGRKHAMSCPADKPATGRYGGQHQPRQPGQRLVAMVSSIYFVLKNTAQRAAETRLMIYAGYAALALLLALFPFAIFLVALAGLLGTSEQAEQLITYLLAMLPAEIVETVAPVIKNIMTSQNTGLLTIGIVVAIWVASSGLEGLRIGLNHVYEVKEWRVWWKRRLQGLIFVLFGAVAFSLLTTLVIVAPLFINFIGAYFSLTYQELIALNIVRYGFGFLLLVAVTTFLYTTLPNVRLAWQMQLPGAVLATVLWMGLAALFSLYLSNFGNYEVTYGSLGGIIITMVFFHYSAAAILLGAAFNMAIRERSVSRPPEEEITREQAESAG